MRHQKYLMYLSVHCYTSLILNKTYNFSRLVCIFNTLVNVYTYIMYLQYYYS